MATVLVFGEQVQVFLSLGVIVDAFTLDTSVLNGSDVLDGTDVEDVAEYVQSVSINRGRSDQFSSFRSGACTIVLNNLDRRFDPTNDASPYYDATTGRSGVTPRRKVQIVGDNVPLFTGRITDIDVEYNRDVSTVTITASDDFTLIANTSTNVAQTPPVELSGARVSRILDLPEVAYPIASRNIDAGVATLGAYPISENTNAAAYLSRVAIAEQGLFFCAADGKLTFTDRASVAFRTPVVDFADIGLGLPYQSLSTIIGNEFLFNRVQTTVESGVPQVAEDAQSQSDYGISTLNLDGLLLGSDADALVLANELLSFYKQPTYRFDDLRCTVSAMSSGDRVDVLDIEMGDVISVTRNYAVGNPPTVIKEYAVERITHQILPDRHIVTFGLFDALIAFPLILDDVTFGQLSERNALA
jgi:hypothetical protein